MTATARFQVRPPRGAIRPRTWHSAGASRRAVYRVLHDLICSASSVQVSTVQLGSSLSPLLRAVSRPALVVQGNIDQVVRRS